MSIHSFRTINSFRENRAKEKKIAGMVTICACLENAGTKILATTRTVVKDDLTLSITLRKFSLRYSNVATEHK